MAPPYFGATGTYDADTLKHLRQVFDEVWRSIAGNYASPSAIELARTELANVILGLAPTNGTLDVERIKYGALVAMGHKECPAASLEQVRADVAKETRFDALRRSSD